MEDAHSHKRDIVLCYLDFKGAFRSIDHKQLVLVLEFLDLPSDLTRLVSNLYSGATTEFITPHGHTSPVGIRRGILQRDPLSPLLFDLMVKLLIRWLKVSGKGYDIASCGLKLARKWYADDGTLITNSIEDMISLLDIIQQLVHGLAFTSMPPNMRLLLTSTHYNLSPPKRDLDVALRSRLAHGTLAGRPIGALT